MSNKLRRIRVKQQHSPFVSFFYKLVEGSEKDEKELSWALMWIYSTGYAVLAMIATPKQYRGKGYASRLLGFLTKNFPLIYTEAETPEVEKLLLKAGFQKRTDGKEHFVWENPDPEVKRTAEELDKALQDGNDEVPGNDTNTDTEKPKDGGSEQA